MREPLHSKGPVNDGRKGILRQNMIVLTLIVVLLVLGFALRAKATPAPILEKIVVKRGLTNHARKVRCLPPLIRVYVPAFRVPVGNRPSNLVKETNRLRNARTKDSRCLVDMLWTWYRTSGAACVKSKEGAWTSNTGNGYYGGFQADMSFQAAYGGEYLARWGTANNWPAWAQIHMAYRGWSARGWNPWPNTARACGLL